MFGQVNHFQEFEKLQNFSKISKVYLNLFLGNSFSILSFSMETSHGKSIKLQKMLLKSFKNSQTKLSLYTQEVFKCQHNDSTMESTVCFELHSYSSIIESPI